jgi:hypothetical protein
MEKYMADRTKQTRTTIEVAPSVKQQLNDYKRDLYSQMNRRATQEEIISALLSGVPLWQADVMLGAYKTHGLSINPPAERDA